MTEKLTSEESWQFLREREFGRLAFHLAGEVHITPINYAADESSLLFRTSEGNKLLGIVMHEDVAFEVDEITDDEACSVIVRGKAHHLEGEDAYRAEHVGVRPWLGHGKHNVVEIVPTQVTGRRFELSKPWVSIMPQA